MRKEPSVVSKALISSCNVRTENLCVRFGSVNVNIICDLDKSKFSKKESKGSVREWERRNRSW